MKVNAFHSKKDPGRLARIAAGVSFAAVLAVMLGASAESVAAGQETVAIPDKPSCEECEISVRRVALLGEDSGDGMLLSANLHATRDPEGRYYVYEYDVGSTVKVFDGHGEFVDVLGRQGAGPAEFAKTHAVRVGPSGRIYIVDGNNGRISVLSPSLEYLESFVLSIRPRWDPVLLSDTRMLFATPGTGRDTAGYPLHLISLETPGGGLVRSFGSDGLLVPNRGGRRRIGSAGVDAVWSVDPDSPVQRFERWTVDGDLTTVLIKEKGGWLDKEYDWARSEFRDILREHPTFPLASPSTSALHEDEDGLLWVLTLTADSDLKSLLAQQPPGGLIIGPVNRIQDTVVEVIDISSGVVLARTKFDRRLRPIGRNLVHGVVETDDGGIQLEVLAIRIEGTGGR